MKNYRNSFNRTRDTPTDSTEVLECPPINPQLIAWLESQYPVRRYPKEIIRDPGFNLIVACDEGRYEVIDQLKVALLKQQEKE